MAAYRTACIRMRKHNNIDSTLCIGKRQKGPLHIFSKCGSKLYDFWHLSCNEISFKWLTNPNLCECITLWLRTTQTVAEHCLDLFHKVMQSHGLGLVSHFRQKKNVQWKKRSERHKHCALAVVRRSQKISSRRRLPSRGRGTAKI